MICIRPTPLLLAAASLLVGCQSSSDTGRFVPSQSSARQALETALDSWKTGQAPGHIEDHKPPIEVVDSKWKDGQKLSGYEITGEETNSEGHHRFAVKLTVNPGGAVQAHYVVFGQNPLWVYREEDYAKLSGTGR